MNRLDGLVKAGVERFVGADFWARCDIAELVHPWFPHRGGLVTCQILALFFDALQVVYLKNVTNCMSQMTTSIHGRSVVSWIYFNRGVDDHIPRHPREISCSLSKLILIPAVNLENGRSSIAIVILTWAQTVSIFLGRLNLKWAVKRLIHLLCPANLSIV